jgi:threonine dehydrogenase-like Zn-dependent dehydrogenase
VVNAAAGREALFATPQIPHGERIAVIGAGPAGLTYASLIAQGNKVTVFEKEAEPGGAFKSAAKAPLFQEVETEPRSFARYIADLTAACRAKGVQFHFATDAAAAGALLAGFDRIVIATGASYRFGLRAMTKWLLDSGIARAPGITRLLKSPPVRNWFYYRARSGSAPRFRHLARPGQRVIVIGDAASAGKSKEAIASAFAAALLGGGREGKV